MRRVPCEGLIFALVKSQTRTQPFGIRAYTDTAQFEHQS